MLSSICLAVLISGCTTTHLSVSGSPAIARAIDGLIAHPKPTCSAADTVELAMRAEQTYTYRSNERGRWQWNTLTINRDGSCEKRVTIAQ